MSISLFKKGKLKAGEFKSSGLTMPSGAVFDLPLSSATDTAVTGQMLNYEGNVIYGKRNGIPCAYFDGSSGIVTSENIGLSGNQLLSVSLWFESIGDFIEWVSAVHFGEAADGRSFNIGTRDNLIYSGTYGYDVYSDIEASGKMWHCVSIFDGEMLSLYVDGVLIGTTDVPFDLAHTPVRIGRGGQAGSGNFNGAIAAVKIYDRVLSAEEIQTLAQEFIPTTVYETSSGFDAFGHPIKYDTASEAGCEKTLPIPTDGLVFHAPLDKEASTAVTGQTLTKSGTVTYETADGVPMARFNNGYIQSTGGGLPSGNQSRTLSCFCYELEPTGSWPGILYSGASGKDNCLVIFSTPNPSISCEAWSGRSNVCVVDISDDSRQLQHIAVTYSEADRMVSCYKNGMLIAQEVCTAALNTASECYISTLADPPSDSQLRFNGYIASVRIYNRALTDNEIRALSKEFRII